MRIYVASSWRCPHQPVVVSNLRELGYQVYDFRGRGSGWSEGREGEQPPFNWGDIDTEWQAWPSNVKRYLEAFKDPRTEKGFRRDFDALRASDVCLLVNPCGPSAFAEFGWAVGAGKWTAAYCPEIREPELMLMMAQWVTNEWHNLECWLAGVAVEIRASSG